MKERSKRFQYSYNIRYRLNDIQKIGRRCVVGITSKD